MVSRPYFRLTSTILSIDERWQGLRNALAGLFCASLGSLDEQRTTSPHLSFPPEGLLPDWDGLPHEIRHASHASQCKSEHETRQGYKSRTREFNASGRGNTVLTDATSSSPPVPATTSFKCHAKPVRIQDKFFTGICCWFLPSWQVVKASQTM